MKNVSVLCTLLMEIDFSRKKEFYLTFEGYISDNNFSRLRKGQGVSKGNRTVGIENRYKRRDAVDGRNMRENMGYGLAGEMRVAGYEIQRIASVSTT